MRSNSCSLDEKAVLGLDGAAMDVGSSGLANMPCHCQLPPAWGGFKLTQLLSLTLLLAFCHAGCRLGAG